MANILVVDDAYANHRLIGIMLKRNAHTIASVYNGLEALNYLSSTPVDMMITDINMPVMDGLTLLERLRDDTRFRALPVIVITAGGEDYLRRMAVEKGASAFLTQPFSTWELNRAVLECLASPEPYQ